MSDRQLSLSVFNDALARALAATGSPSGRFTLDLREECDSTNTRLSELAESGASSGTLLLAQHQTAGRGRRGRAWCSQPGDSLTFSLLWRFTPGTLPAGLSLAAGVAVVRGLQKVSPPKVSPCGTAPSLTLKWPNDVLLDGRKLAGILVELVPGAPHAAVVGIGINCRLPDNLPDEVRATATCWPEPTPPEILLAAVVHELGLAFSLFASHGFAALRADWQAMHAHQDQAVTLLSDFAAPRHGLCRGVDTDGALLFDTAGHVERILSGEISLRAHDSVH